MTYSMNKRRLAKIIGLCTLVIWLLVLTSMTFKSLNMSSLLMQSEATQTLEHKVAVIEMKIVELAEQQASITDPWVKQTQLVEAQDELRVRIQTLSEHLSGFVQVAEFTKLQTRIQQLETSLETLKTNQTQSVQAVISPVSTTQSLRPQTPVQNNPPFKVLGIELRGGQSTLAVIAPKAANQGNMNAVELLQVGDSFAQWQLTTINGRVAVFKKGTQTRHLTIPNQ